jgi:hypothetical protein
MTLAGIDDGGIAPEGTGRIPPYDVGIYKTKSEY